MAGAGSAVYDEGSDGPIRDPITRSNGVPSMQPQAADLPEPAQLLIGLLVLGMLAVSGTVWALTIGRLRAGVPLIPGRPGREVPWGPGAVFLGFLVWLAVSNAAGQLLVAWRGGVDAVRIADQMAAVAGVNAIVLLIVPLSLRAIAGATAADLGIVRGTIGRDLRLGFGAAMLLAPPIYAVQGLALTIWEPTAHPIQTMLSKEYSPTIAGLAILSAMVLAPAAEELLFRGIFQGWLERRLNAPRPVPMPFEPAPTADESPWAAPTAASAARVAPIARWAVLLLPAVVFAGVHAGQWPAPIPLFLLAIGLGVLYRRTGGIVAPIAMHATFNGISTVLLIVMVETGTLPEEAPPPPPPAVGAPVGCHSTVQIP